jgi:predicted transcriptional regulator
MEEIDSQIIRFLAKQDWPVTTESVGKALHISWNTAQVHLYKLVSEGLIKGKRVGRQNQWMLTENGRNILKK